MLKIFLAFFSSFALSLLMGRYLLKADWYLKYFSQPVRDIGPKHKQKNGTPTSGGIIIAFSTILVSLILAGMSNHYINILIFVLLSFAVIGFIDDYLKIKHANCKGVSARQKFLAQTLISFLVCYYITNSSDIEQISELTIPFAKNISINLGIFYIPFAMFVIIGSSNAVNLTDGLDGLAIIPVIFCICAFIIIAYISGNIQIAEYLNLTYIERIEEINIFCICLIGSGIGFLWYNAHPAQMFMGDIGSISLGATIGTLGIITKQELLLVIIGGVFVAETISVMIQVSYYRYSNGKRFFKMAPLHHHFEKLAVAETKITIRFWIAAFILMVIGLASLLINP